MPREISLIGKVFGRLTVVGKADSYVSPSGKHRDTRWICECSCPDHNRIIVTRHQLKNGITRSCGCLRRENTVRQNEGKRKLNRFDLSGEFGIGYTTGGKEFWFDLEDYDKIKGYCWYYDSSGYLVSNTRDAEGKRVTVALHRLLLSEPPDGFVVDHKNHPPDPTGLKYDNRKENLRYVTRAQNAQNQVPLRSSNSSGHKGVSWNRGGMWKASISANGKRYTKYFRADEFKKACEWYDKMSERLHGEYRFADIEEGKEERKI